MQFLHEARSSGFSQDFGRKLLTFPSFVTNITLAYSTVWGWFQHYHKKSNRGIRHLTEEFSRMTESLCYFDATRRQIFHKIVFAHTFNALDYYVGTDPNVLREIEGDD